jgi:ankyrin repeat protein
MKAIITAIEAGDRDEVRRLLAEDPARATAADDQGVPALRMAYYRRRPDLVDALLEAGAPIDGFDLAALGRADELRERLADDPDLATAWTGDGFTALHYAAFFADAATVRVLLDAGADVAAVARGELTVQPLHSAVAAGALEVCAVLLAHGADPDARHAGYTPLEAALHAGNEPLAGLLLAHGATPPPDRGSS